MSSLLSRLLSSIEGNNLIIERLVKMVQTQRVPHALLFVGPSGTGKRITALSFAQILLCPQKQNGRACGVCGTCKSVEREQAVGLHILEAEKGVIKIDAARLIIRQLALSTFGAARVVIINDSHLLNPQAANALLKSIEEPPDKTFFILLSSSEEGVLKTIRSRTQLVRFRPTEYLEFGSDFKSEDPHGNEFTQIPQIFELIIRGERSLAQDHLKSLAVDREQGIRVAYGMLHWMRREWHQQDLHVAKETLSQWSLSCLELIRNINGNSDLNISLEHYVYVIYESLNSKLIEQT